MVSTSTSPMSTASKPVSAARYPAAVSVFPVDVEYKSAAFISGEPARALPTRFCGTFVLYPITPPTTAPATASMATWDHSLLSEVSSSYTGYAAGYAYGDVAYSGLAYIS